MRTSIVLLSMLFAACGGAQKGSSYSPGAGADVRCFEGGHDIETAVIPQVVKLVFDPANKMVVEVYTDRDHDQNGHKPWDATFIYAVAADGSATGKGDNSSAKFTTGDAFKWTGWTTHNELHTKDITLKTDRTATLAGDKLTYAETSTMDVAGLPTKSTASDTYTQFDCAQYDAKRQALGRATKK